MKFEKRIIICSYCNKIALESEFVIYQFDTGVCRDCSRSNLAYQKEYEVAINKLNNRSVSFLELKKSRSREIENMIKYLENNKYESRIYDDVDFLTLFIENKKSC